MSGIRWPRLPGSSCLGSRCLALLAVTGLAEAAGGAGLHAGPAEEPRVWIDAPDEVPVGVPFELRVGVLGGEGERVTVTPPASSLIVRIGAPLEVPGSRDDMQDGSLQSAAARGWWAIACVAGAQTLPGVRVTGWAEEDAVARWSAETPPRTIRVIGSVAAEKEAALRSDLAWLPDEPTSTPFSTWVLRGALGLASLFVIIAACVRLQSARASGAAPQPISRGSAAREAERALRAALHRYEGGELTAGAALEAAARAARVFVGCVTGVQGLARCADELEVALHVRGDLQLAAGVSRLVRESEVRRYAVPADEADARGEHVRAMMEDALREIGRAGRAPETGDAEEAAVLGEHG